MCWGVCVTGAGVAPRQQFFCEGRKGENPSVKGQRRLLRLSAVSDMPDDLASCPPRLAAWEGFSLERSGSLRSNFLNRGRGKVAIWSLRVS